MNTTRNNSFGITTLGKGLLAAGAGLAATVALVAPASAASPSTVSAQTTAAVAAPVSAFPTVSGGGTGVLVAAGTGTARLSGSLDGSVLNGAGLLVITDHAGDAIISVTGHGVKKTSGNVTSYVGFNGHVKVSGSNVTVRLAGTNVTIAAKGHGSYGLQGSGRYDTTPNAKGGNGIWTAAGVTGAL